MKINKNYLFLSFLLFITEVFIALYVKDDFFRPYFGDFLVVILIYCFLKSFWNLPVLKTALGVLLFAYLIEFLQFLNLVEHLGLQDSRLAQVILGTSFAWMDMLHYTCGIIFVILLEFSFRRRKNRRHFSKAKN